MIGPTVLYLFPLISAALSGLAYALYAKGLQQVPIGTYLLLHALIWVAFAFTYAGITKSTFDIKIFLSKDGAFVAAGSLCLILAMLLILVSVKYISPTFAAMIEVSYMIFTPIFMYALYGKIDFNLQTLIGGLIVLCGIAVVIYGQQHNNPVPAVEATDARL